jgi:acyl-coenzyme A synthetase/AMP-(fatty) acid ligase
MHEHFNVSEWLVDRHVDAGNGDRIAIRSGGESFTYADVLHRVEAAAAGLRVLGVRSEERVAMVMLDSVEFVAMFLGAMRIGAVPVPMNPLLPGRDLGVIVADSRARVVAISAAREQSLTELRDGASEVETVITSGASGDGQLGWADFVGAGSDGSVADTWAESPGFWLCTSGSTGQPKLAMHRHADIPATCETYADQVLGITADDICFSVGPMFHCIPTFYAALLAADLADDSFGSVRFGVSAAEALPAETFERFRQRFGVTILDGIGSTEQLHIYLSNAPAGFRPGTSGRAVPGYEVRVVDESDNDQVVDVPGQLLVRGPSVATGYWCRSDTTRATFEGEWMRTGDLYAVDVDGFHTYLGRVDDMLRVGGEWVSPAEVEGVLIAHRDVLEAAIVGLADDQNVTRPVAFVVTVDGATPSADDLTEHCRSRLAGYKRPKVYRMVDELPKTATGKIQRFKLRAL